VNRPSLEILAWEETPLGVLCLRRRALLSRPGETVTEITLDHEFLMSSLHTESERALAGHAIDWHGGHGLRVMVGGLGLGYTAEAVLDRAQVASVTVVELLPQVIQWLREGRVPLSERLTPDPRLAIEADDVYARLAGPGRGEWDVVLVDVDHSPEDRLDHGAGRFYTPEGLALARAHLAPGGILGVWSYAEHTPFADAMRGAFREIRVEAVSFRNVHIGETQTDWLFFGRM
jgi:spermidine synthase